MNSYDAYKKYVALKLHFQQDSYDYFKFSGNVKIDRTTFDRRRDKYFFERLSKIYNEAQYENLLVSNFIIDSNLWIGDILSEIGKRNYLEWKKTNQSLAYTFQDDLIKLKEFLEKTNLNFNYLFIVKDTWPEIVNLTMQKHIKIETFIIINKILNFIPSIDLKIKDTLLWPNLKKLALKYSPFLNVDISKYKTIMKTELL